MFALSKKIRNLLIAFIVGGYILLFFAYLQLPDRRFHIWFLDVGQGDAIFIKTPENHQILVDGGPNNVVMEELAQVLPFFDKTIDLLVLTHPHADHLDGLVSVLKRYELKNVLFTGVDSHGSTYEEFLKEIKIKNIPVFIANSGTDFVFGDVFLDVIYPFDSIAGKSFENVNNSSVALKVSYLDHSILLTGDLEIEAETELVFSDIDLSADIFKAGHHGSKTSSSFALLTKVSPEIVVIQVGEDNTHGHPSPSTLRNLHRMEVSEIHRNDEDGRVEFVF